jgi:hypothetical protein
VGCVWTLLSLTAGAFVWAYASNVPHGDEWVGLLPALTGEQPVTVSYLWSQHNEHRIFLPRLIALAAFHLGNRDLRAVMFFNIAALSGLALALVLACRALRGSVSYGDAFFPLVLLNLAQYENLFVAFQVQMVSSALLAGILLLLIVRNRKPLKLGPALLAGTCVVSLPLCGANGLVLAPAFALWLGCTGVLAWRSGEPHAKRNGLVLLAFAAAALFLVWFYFVDFWRPAMSGTRSGLDAVAMTCLEFISDAVGSELGRSWWPFVGIVLLALLLVTAVVLVWAWVKQPGERFRAGGLLLFLGAVASLILALGWGRAVLGKDAGFESRYVTLMAPALCWVYLVWALPSRRGSGLVHTCLFTLACIPFLANAKEATGWAEHVHEHDGVFTRDLLAGTPVSLLSQRYADLFSIWDSNAAEKVAHHLRQLRQAGVGMYWFIRDDPPSREVPVPVEPVSMNQVEWKDGVAKGLGNDAYLVFALRQSRLLGLEPRLVYDHKMPRLVHGIRLRYSYEAGAGTAYFQMTWGRGSDADSGGNARLFAWNIDVGPGEQERTIWVYDTIDQFRVQPDSKPYAFKLLGITLLVPSNVPDPVPPPSVLRTPFARAQALEPITVEDYEGKPVLRVHAPSAVEFDVPARSGPSRVAGKFGILPGTYGNPSDHTDGVQFAVEYAPSGEEPKVLFERFLDPHDEPKDRGMHNFAVALPAGEKGTVILKASNPPDKSAHLDWSFWTDVEIESAQPRTVGPPEGEATKANKQPPVP